MAHDHHHREPNLSVALNPKRDESKNKLRNHGVFFRAKKLTA